MTPNSSRRSGWVSPQRHKGTKKPCYMTIRMKRYAILTFLVLAGIVPFSSRAVFMDEHIYLQIAKSAQTNWLFPHDTPGMFFGIQKANYADHTDPPVGEYYLAFVYALLGRFHEVSFRLLFSIFPIIAVLSFFSLARRFT